MKVQELIEKLRTFDPESLVADIRSVGAEQFSDLPEPTIPGYKVFIKSNNNNGLVDLLDKGLPDVLQVFRR
ncbi:MAG TPA: hypothetical protein PKC28_11765 [Bdellovibrionales bacterium]|nr:hypothetical protein [Bdellovibrionales bacterium]